MIRFGADGKIVEFEVMVRPAGGVALGEAMAATDGAHVATKLIGFFETLIQ